MGKITIKGQLVLYDNCDEGLIESRKWHMRYGWNETPYAYSAIGAMHRLIMDCPKGLLVDHINHNTLDNRRENLRICTRAQNMWNRKKSCGSSKYKGVYWCRTHRKWVGEININDKKHKNKYCKTEIEAALWYNEQAKEIFGEFACLNIIGDKP